jgi:hypothetical protein
MPMVALPFLRVRRQGRLSCRRRSGGARGDHPPEKWDVCGGGPGRVLVGFLWGTLRAFADSRGQPFRDSGLRFAGGKFAARPEWLAAGGSLGCCTRLISGLLTGARVLARCLLGRWHRAARAAGMLALGVRRAFQLDRCSSLDGQELARALRDRTPSRD